MWTLVPSPPFIRRSCLPAVDEGFFALADTLVVASSSVRTPVSSVSTKSTYSLRLEFLRREQACVRIFGLVFGPLYWPSTWSQLFWFSLDRSGIDISWQIALRVPRTGHRLVSSLGMSHIPLPVFVIPRWSRLLIICFSRARLHRLYYPDSSLMSHFSALILPLVCRHVLFGLNSDELRVVPRGFVYMLNVCKYFLWSTRNDNRFRDIAPCSGTVCTQLCARVRFHLPLLFKCFRSSRRRRYFVCQWGARGVIASIVDGKLVVHL